MQIDFKLFGLDSLIQRTSLPHRSALGTYSKVDKLGKVYLNKFTVWGALNPDVMFNASDGTTDMGDVKHSIWTENPHDVEHRGEDKKLRPLLNGSLHKICEAGVLRLYLKASRNKLQVAQD